jgi:hypothetical protein
MSDSLNDMTLEERVAELTGSSLGLDVFPRRNWMQWRPAPASGAGENYYAAGILMTAKYLTVFCLFPWLVHKLTGRWFGSGTGSLYVLQIYGGLWAGWATATTGLTARALRRTIDTEIIPVMSEAAVLATSRELGQRFERRHFLTVSWSFGFLSAGLAGILVRQDIGAYSGQGEILFWSAGWAILFATSAGVVNVARYYAAFANHLEDDAPALFVLSPDRSPLLTSIASLGHRTLMFWLSIAVSIALILPFSIVDWSHFPQNVSLLHGFTIETNRFVLVDVVATSFFSIGVGTVVFLGSEAALRRAARISANVTLRSIEVEVARLFAQMRELDDAGWKRLSELKNLHEEVAVAGSYRGAVFSGISILIPFITPVLSLILKYLHIAPKG